MKSNKKTVVIIGSSRGLGKSIALFFLELNYDVIGIGRNKKKLQQLDKKYDNFTGFQLNIKNNKDVKNIFKKIQQEVKTIDILINNAAVFKKANFIDCNFSDINHLVDTNLKGIMFTTMEALKIMISNHTKGRIINIASVASIHGIAQQSIYCATKYGLNGFAEALNQELIQEYNISITTLFPGGIDTSLWNKKNKYPGDDKENILKKKDIIKCIDQVVHFDSKVIVKNMTIFPSNEWH
jgi:short-subunit dehydrogenase